MSRGELLQQDLADLDLVAYGAMIAAAVVVSLSGHKECGEDQAAISSAAPQTAAKRIRFVKFFSLLCTIYLWTAPALTRAVRDGIGDDRLKALRLSRRGISALREGHAKRTRIGRGT